MPEKIAIIGDGAMGTVCAATLAQQNHHVTLWSYNPDQLHDIMLHHENRRFLPGYKLPPNLKYSPDDQTILTNIDFAVSAAVAAAEARIG